MAPASGTASHGASAREAGAGFVSARKAQPWPQRLSSSSSPVRSSFTSRNRRRLAPPPGLDHPCSGGSGGPVPDGSLPKSPQPVRVIPETLRPPPMAAQIFLTPFRHAAFCPPGKGDESANVAIGAPPSLSITRQRLLKFSQNNSIESSVPPSTEINALRLRGLALPSR